MDVNEAHESAQEVESWALLSSITFKGTFHGCLAIGCDTSCAQAITKNMLGIDTTEELSEEEVCNALGEVVNMLMGCVKARLPEFNKVKVSIPSVVNGSELRNYMGSNDEANRLAIEVYIDDKYPAKFTLLYRKTMKLLTVKIKKI